MELNFAQKKSGCCLLPNFQNVSSPCDSISAKVSPLAALIFCFYNFCVFLLINPAITHIIIKHPPARKSSIAFFCKSPNKKKLGASDVTNKKYPPVAINMKAMSKVNVLNIDAIDRTRPKTCKLLSPK